MSIPKIIHYCWFGGNSIPELGLKCIESWKKYFPDYEIRQWDETNFDLNINNYVKEAYEQKKWAFVSDYARFWILYNYGGIYFDTDVEVVKKPSEEIINSCFMGEEDSNHNWNKSTNSKYQIASGLGLSANSGLGLYKEILEYYDNEHFLLEDGTLNLETVVSRVTKILEKYGYRGNKTIERVKGVTVYPPDYFCAMNPDDGIIRITDNTISIHHYADTWHSEKEKQAIKLSKKFENKGTLIYIVGRVFTLPIRIAAKLERLGIKNTIKFILNKF